MSPAVSKVLPRILGGEERDSLLAAMRELVVAPATDARLVEIARRDPSLLLEDSWLEAHRLGTLLDAAVYFDHVDSVRVAFEAGVHPDDPVPYQVARADGQKLGGRRLIEWRGTLEHRLPSPKMLSLALQHGSHPDGARREFQGGLLSSHARRYAISLNRHQTRHMPDWSRTLECIRTLLGAGAKNLDPEPYESAAGWSGFLALLGCASVLQERPPLDSEEVGQFRDLARLALEKGASLNYVVPDEGLPQALVLAKSDYPTMALLLVELGAAESWKLSPGVDPESFFKGETLGLFREALMRRRLQLEATAAPQAKDQAPASRRRMAVL